LRDLFFGNNFKQTQGSIGREKRGLLKNVPAFVSRNAVRQLEKKKSVNRLKQIDVKGLQATWRSAPMIIGKSSQKKAKSWEEKKRDWGVDLVKDQRMDGEGNLFISQKSKTEKGPEARKKG